MVQQKGSVGGDGEDGWFRTGRDSRRIAVARAASRDASTSSTSKKARAELRKSSSEKEGQAMDHAMRRQDEEAGAVHVDEGHHDELVGRRIWLIRRR